MRPVIARQASAIYEAAVSFRSLFAVLVALAMVFAPLGMRDGAAMASTPHGQHGQMMEAGHCGEQPSNDHHGKPVNQSCCASMCGAVTLHDPPGVAAHSLQLSSGRPALDRFGRSLIIELPTPPPRVA